METDSNLSNSNEETQKSNEDILSYIRYCYENQWLEKELKIFNLRSRYSIEYFWSEKNRNYLLAEKMYEFQKKLEYYHAKNDKDWFNKSFEKVFHKKERHHLSSKYVGMRSLVGYVLNKDKNKWFWMYKECLDIHRKELFNAIQWQNHQLMDNTKIQTNQQFNNEFNDDGVYTEYEYNEKILIWEDNLERKYLDLLDDNKNQNDIIKKAIKEFTSEEKKNYSEWELDTIVSLFYEKNRLLLSQQPNLFS